MNFISLNAWDIALAASLVIALSIVLLGPRFTQNHALSRSLLWAALRTVVQLSLIGLVLQWLFDNQQLWWVALMSLSMLTIAGYEIRQRQKRRFQGAWGYGLGVISLFISSFTITVIALNLIIRSEPWYTPQYAIPLLGMLLGNTMTGIALGLDRLTQEAWRRRTEIEGRLLLGEDWKNAISDVRSESLRAGLIPIINAMAAAGVVSLPGMMTGQILAGAPPLEAVKYQILMMFLIAAGAGFGLIAALALGARRLFDERQRLRLDRLN